MSRNYEKKPGSGLFQFGAALILGVAVYFKLRGGPEVRALFERLDAEPGGRVLASVFEIVAVVFLLQSRRAALGALLAMVLMGGAIFLHLTELGIMVEYRGDSDGGTLFALAVLAFLCASAVVWKRRAELPVVGDAFRPREV